jgi:hypothetical protein
MDRITEEPIKNQKSMNIWLTLEIPNYELEIIFSNMQ